MRHFPARLVRRLAVIAVSIGGYTAAALHGLAAEPSREFLEMLRQRKYYDHALDYLTSLPQNPLATEEARQTVPLEIALTLRAESNELRDPVQRDERLDRAAVQFKAFLAAQPDHPQASMAQSQLADVSLERANLLLARAERALPQDKNDLLRDARRMLTDAEQVYAAALDEARTELKSMGTEVPASDRDAIAKRDKFRKQWVQSRMSIAEVTYKKSKAALPTSSDRTQFLTDAAKQYTALADDFKLQLVGMYARLLAGICYQDLDEHGKAIQAFEAVLAVPEDQDKEVLALKVKAIKQSLECWNKTEQYAEAIKRVEPLISNSSRGSDNVEPDWIASKYLLAVAMGKHAAALKSADPQQAKLVGQAKKLAQEVMRTPGDYKAPAATLLAQLNKSAAAADRPAADRTSPDKKPAEQANSFDAANKLVTQALEDITALQLQVGMAQESKEHQDELPALKKQLSARQAEVVGVVRQALALQNAQSPIDQVNRLRYTLAYLLFGAEDFGGAAVVGDFVARRYPDYELAKACGEIALKAYVRQYQLSPDDEPNRVFERAKVGETASFLMEKWPGEKVANEAVHWLLYVTVGRNDIDAAMALIEKLPADSPQRLEAQVRIGRLLWAEYQRQARLKDDRRPPQAQLDKLLKNAESMLDLGVQSIMQRGEPSTATVDTLLALAQIYLDTSQPNKAISLLEHEKVGPLTLVNAEHKATQRERLPFEIFRAALRAYITVQPPRLDDAQKVMNRLEQVAGRDPQSGEVLTAVYISMGRDLQRQLEELRDRGDAQGMKAVSGAFEEFLKRIAQRGGGGNFSSLNWVADTLFTLGQSVQGGSGQAPEKARQYYAEAVKTYEQILSQSEKDPEFAPNADSLTGVKLRLAICRRGLGVAREMEKAIATLSEILRDKPSLIAVQVEAARTYQAWGALNPNGYAAAMQGGAKNTKTGENVIWGWGRIANLMVQQMRREDLPEEQLAAFRSRFYEARYQLAQCRYDQAMSHKGDDQKRLLELARQDVRHTYQLFPALGGDEWRPQYVALLKKIQKQLGQHETGLSEFSQQPATADAK